MSFFLTPRFAPAYQQCGPFSCAPARPTHPRVSRPTFPNFVPFLSQVDEIIDEIDREARRAAHQQRQQRKRAFRARFDVRENNEGYQVEGEVPGFEQANLTLEVTDEHTLKVAGNTEQKAEQTQAQPEAQPENVATPAPPAEVFSAQATDSEKMDGVTLTETEVRPSTPDSDTSSRKSYNATVEDDFEDLGAETSSTVSAAPAEPKGKEKAVEQSTETAVQEAPKPEVPAQQQQPQDREWLSERVHGSFERTFQFPERIDAENVRAALRNGVLSITVPKKAAPAIRHITIQ